MPIALTRLNHSQAKLLVTILNTDLSLRNSLGITSQINSPEFLRIQHNWERKQDGTTYAILLDSSPIGTISLSKPDGKLDVINIGYWLASPFWNKGYGTTAFQLALSLAKTSGAKTATACIPKKSNASYRIWQKAGATFTETPSNWVATLIL